MYKKILSSFFLLFFIIAVPFLMVAKQKVHNFDGKCDGCHLSFEGERMIFLRDIDFLCRDCHVDSGFSHPSGQKPEMEMPGEFPVDWAGRMTCATCHAVHEENKYLLRGNKTGRLFCYSCHKGTFESHQEMDHLAHSESTVPGTRSRDWSFVDKLSRECMGCHDSTMGGYASMKLRGVWSHGSGASHPVGVSYMRAFIKSSGGYVDPARMNKAVKLFDGKVGCGSCHNIFSKEDSLLTVRQGRSGRLCLSCHIK